MSEAELLRLVLELANLLGYLAYHTHDSRHSRKGFPDLVLARRERLVFIELKSEAGQITPDQQQWLDTLRGTGPGVEVYLFRPSDWDSIAQILR